MYVATRQLKVIGRDNSVTLFQAGDEVVGFEKWPDVAQRAHLNLEYVVEKAGPKKVEVKTEATKATESSCSECERVFGSPKALKAHISLKHKG